MFRTRPESRPAGAGIDVLVAGIVVSVPQGASAATAVLLAGAPAIRITPVGGFARLPYCMMGICFDCLAGIDGVPNRQACMVPVSPGMRIEPQQGARGYRTDVSGKEVA